MYKWRNFEWWVLLWRHVCNKTLLCVCILPQDMATFDMASQEKRNAWNIPYQWFSTRGQQLLSQRESVKKKCFSYTLPGLANAWAFSRGYTRALCKSNVYVRNLLVSTCWCHFFKKEMCNLSIMELSILKPGFKAECIANQSQGVSEYQFRLQMGIARLHVLLSKKIKSLRIESWLSVKRRM